MDTEIEKMLEFSFKGIERVDIMNSMIVLILFSLASCELPYAIGIRLVKGKHVKQVTVICIVLIIV